jgi:glycine cleavage system H protein
MKEETRRMGYPGSYRYTREHEWIDAGAGKVGITDYAQSTLGDIVFVDLPKVGATIEKGKVFGSVESVKAVSDLYSPVTGTVLEVNEELATAPEKINTDAHGAWMLKVKITDPSQLDGLLSAEDYEKYVKEETH